MMKNHFDPVEFAILNDTGFFGVPEEKLEEIAEAMQSGRDLFRAAWDCGIDPANLTDEDRARIRDLLGL